MKEKIIEILNSFTYRADYGWGPMVMQDTDFEQAADEILELIRELQDERETD